LTALAVSLVMLAPTQPISAAGASGDHCDPVLSDAEAHDVMDTAHKLPGLPAAEAVAVKGRIQCTWGAAGANGQGVALNAWVEVVDSDVGAGRANVGRIARQWCRVHPAKARCVQQLTDADTAREFLTALVVAHRQAGGSVTRIDTGSSPAFLVLLPNRLLTGAVAVVGGVFMGVQCVKTPTFRIHPACSAQGLQSVLGNYLAARKAGCKWGRGLCELWMPPIRA
jgi:hypothetical protein